MKTSELIELRLARLRTVARSLHLSLATERTYCGWMRRFIGFTAGQADCLTAQPADLARRFVEAHAEGWAVATQDQFRNALAFYFKRVLERPLGELGAWAHAKRPERLPVWLPHAEMIELIAHLRGPMRLMASIAYGSGLRSQELARLRVKDLDFTAQTITVRGGKGGKDRVTFLPAGCAEELRAHLDDLRRLHLRDRRLERPGVEVPSVKFDGRDWAWFWIWAAPDESTDPRSGIVRRHHVHKTTLGKALRVAVRRSGCDRRVTQHSFRHSFATTLLDRGIGIHVVSRLLGHAHISTTEIYAHLLPRQAVVQACSPLDLPMGKVLAFPGGFEPLKMAELAAVGGK